MGFPKGAVSEKRAPLLKRGKIPTLLVAHTLNQAYNTMKETPYFFTTASYPVQADRSGLNSGQYRRAVELRAREEGNLEIVMLERGLTDSALNLGSFVGFDSGKRPTPITSLVSIPCA